MEIVHDSSRGYYGKEMFTILPFISHAFTSNIANIVFHIISTTSRQRLARYEGLTSVSRQLRGKNNKKTKIKYEKHFKNKIKCTNFTIKSVLELLGTNQYSHVIGEQH